MTVALDDGSVYEGQGDLSYGYGLEKSERLDRVEVVLFRHVDRYETIGSL